MQSTLVSQSNELTPGRGRDCSFSFFVHDDIVNDQRDDKTTKTWHLTWLCSFGKTTKIWHLSEGARMVRFLSNRTPAVLLP